MDGILSQLAFTTSGSLIDLVDKKVLISLRDGRKLIGVLRSYDQYANLVLTGTVERIYHPASNAFAEADRGVYLVRGENVVLLGEIDLDREDEPPRSGRPPATQVGYPELTKVLIDEEKKRKEGLKRKEEVLRGRSGFGEEGGEGDAY